MMSSFVRVKRGVFVRHAGDESIVCSPRTGGCSVMRYAKPILDELTRKWRDVNEIVRAVAAKFTCSVKEVSEGVGPVVEELISQQFVEMTKERVMPLAAIRGKDIRPLCDLSSNNDKNGTLLGDFYQRHGLPSELHLDLTDGCNEKCVHCYLPKRGANYLNKTIALKVLKEFREAQGLTILVSGGECMLHKDFCEILRYANSLNLNIVVMSNLTLCDEKMVEFLKEIDPQFINVSLYAVTDSIHDSITQVPGSCSKTKSAIDALKNAGVHIRIATPFMRENKNCVDELNQFAAVRHMHLIPDAEIFGQTDHTCVNQTHALSIDELKTLVSGHRDLFLKIPLNQSQCEFEAKVCDIGDARLNLDAKGLYYPCDGFHGAIIGDAHKESLWDVWTGGPLNKLRELKNGDFGTCSSCINRAWCKVCPMRNFNETGDMFTHATWRCMATQIYRQIFEEK